MNTEDFQGFLLINKPTKISSFDCIRHLQKIIQKKIKIGHAGTLDVFASGLMIIAIGRQATKSLSFLSKLSKEYIATAKLGELTDTLDNTGTTISTTDASLVQGIELSSAIAQFGSEYEQIPPIYSALKHKGWPLYELARQKKLDNESITALAEKKARTVKLHLLEIVSFDPPFFTIKANVSKGTYIRTLMDDIAKKTGHHATTHKLERTKIGPFLLENSLELEPIKTIDDIEQHLIPIEQLTTIDL